jgi:hypothetical protein
MRKRMLFSWTTVLLLQTGIITAQQTVRIKLSDDNFLQQLVPVNRTLEKGMAGDTVFLKVNGDNDEGLVWLPVPDFETGTIEIRMRGKDVFQRSFIGLAFHGVNDSTYDAVYCRPFNFRAADSVRRIHAIQYIAHPHFTWKLLRETRNAEFEKAIQPPPHPAEWLTLRLDIGPELIKAYVNGASVPSLIVKKLNSRLTGKTGIFMGDGSDGDFDFVELTYSKK